MQLFLFVIRQYAKCADLHFYIYTQIHKSLNIKT